MKVLTCNARKELRGAKVRELVAAVSARRPDIIGWQEVETAEHRAAIKALAGYETYWPGGGRGGPADAIPISWRRGALNVTITRYQETHKGQRSVTPARGFSWIVGTDPRGQRWPVLNTHLLNIPNDPRWKKHAAMMQRRLKLHLRKWGRALLTGDVNRSRYVPPPLVGLWAKSPTHGKGYLDVIGVAGRIAVVGAATRFDTPSDHDALVVTLEAAP